LQQRELKDENYSDPSHLCLTASPTQNHSQTITVFLTIAYLQFFRGERVAQGIVGPSSVALRMAEPVPSFITVLWSPLWW